MTKEELAKAVDVTMQITKDVLQTVVDAMNHGQKKQIVKDEKVKALFDIYGVEYT